MDGCSQSVPILPKSKEKKIECVLSRIWKARGANTPEPASEGKYNLIVE